MDEKHEDGATRSESGLEGMSPSSLTAVMSQIAVEAQRLAELAEAEAGRVRDEAAEVLRSAREEADRLVRDARNEVERVRQAAESELREIRSMVAEAVGAAQRNWEEIERGRTEVAADRDKAGEEAAEAARLLAEARQQAEVIRSTALEERGRLLREAEESAGTVLLALRRELGDEVAALRDALDATGSRLGRFVETIAPPPERPGV